MNYAEYLTSMRGQNTDHICERNVGRVKTDGGDKLIDGECRCQCGNLTRDDRKRLTMTDGPMMYSKAKHMDEWRLHAGLAPEDFPGEYRVVMSPQSVETWL